MSSSQPQQSGSHTTFPKRALKRVNSWLSAYNSKQSANIWHRIYKWNYDHHFLKNMLKITNKILKGLNKYHVFKVDYVYMALGLGLGYATNFIEDNWDNVRNFDLKPQIDGLIIKEVLKNQSIRLKLQQVINENVLTNQDVQTNLHYVLMNKVLNPQRSNINTLVKEAIQTLLRSEQIIKMAEQEAVNAIRISKPLIARQAFKFLGGPDMQSIIVKFVPPLIRGQIVQQSVSSQVIGFVTSQLNNQTNQEKVYQYLRQKVI